MQDILNVVIDSVKGIRQALAPASSAMTDKLCQTINLVFDCGKSCPVASVCMGYGMSEKTLCLLQLYDSLLVGIRYDEFSLGPV